MADISRRNFLIGGVGTWSAIWTAGCRGGLTPYLHGVASGDPQSDRVIIWTRIEPEGLMRADRKVYGRYEVARDPLFRQSVCSGTFATDAQKDFTVKIDVVGLESAQQYYYRFITDGFVSPTGKTRTAGKSSQRKVFLAFFSCANYTSGYFNAYGYAEKLDKIDAVVHLGDYIYEYGMKDADGSAAYGTKNAAKIGRELPAWTASECRTLDDYRKRYALYRRDPMLQKLHRSVPFLCIWDDHEMVNDTGSEQADGMDEDTFARRKRAAVTAYAEWMPVRMHDEKQIYRQVRFGDLVTLYLLDTRLEGRSQRIDLAKEIEDKAFSDIDASALFGILSSDRRAAMMSERQWQWFERSFRRSKTRWNVVAQQVLVAPIALPAELVVMFWRYVNAATGKDEKRRLRTRIETVGEELAAIRLRMLKNDASLTHEERLRVTTVLPVNTDAWDGYPHQRARLLKLLAQRAESTLVFSGDSHNAWLNRLDTSDGRRAGWEIGVPSVTSPGIESELELTTHEKVEKLEEALALFCSDVRFCNLSERGFVVAEFMQEGVNVHWLFMQNVEAKDIRLNMARCRRFQISLPGGHDKIAAKTTFY